jgi:hypothetical protein
MARKTGTSAINLIEVYWVGTYKIGGFKNVQLVQKKENVSRKIDGHLQFVACTSRSRECSKALL